MEIYIEGREESEIRKKLDRKVDRSLEILAEELESERLPLARVLATILQDNIPPEYLAAPSAQQLAAWLDALIEIIENRRARVRVEITPFGDQGHALLVSNSPDAPYLLDSIQVFLKRRNVQFRVIGHPIMTVRRADASVEHLGFREDEGPLESLILIEIEGSGEEDFTRLKSRLEEILVTVLAVERDREVIQEHLRKLEDLAEESNEREFWRWLQHENFLPFSYQALEGRPAAGEDTVIAPSGESVLGMTPPAFPDLEAAGERSVGELPEAQRRLLQRERAVVVETLDRISPVYRPENLVYIGCRESRKEGGWTEHGFLGLFSQKSVDELTHNVPFLQQRIEGALERLLVPENSHDYRKTLDILNTFPKVELFFMDDEELRQMIRSFTLLYRYGAVKVVAARSLAISGLTLLVMMPREFYSGESLSRIESYLCRYFKCSIATSRIIHLSANYMSLHVGVAPDTARKSFNIGRLERALTDIARPWSAKLLQQFRHAFGDRQGYRLWERYQGEFSREYRAIVHPRFAVRDVRNLERVRASGEEVFDLWGPFKNQERYYRLQFYSPRESYLNDLMPYLENLSLCVIEEVDFAVRIAECNLFIKSFSIRETGGENHKLSDLRDHLLEILGALRRGEVENDYLNRLLVPAGLSCKEIDVFRGYRNYYFQLGSPFTKRRVAFALIHNPRAALLLYRYFEARFRLEDEGRDRLQREEEVLSPLRQDLVVALAEVEDINEDRILRTLFNLIDSTVRTNFFLRRDRPDYFFAFKISAIGIIDMPAPRPLFEIYVHSATMEGIHLRGGEVARGGIRWSDRPDDFRTEILGLMKTQMTKNALIVPVGSKGGYVVKTPFRTREEGAELSKQAYKTLMRGLLDLTDNRAGGEVERPEGVVVYDETDPYLVVAADKGTAHLSDTANAVAAEYRYWLDDAFASGGSRGYDHKELGITARGAWECVKRHFREMGVDIQAEPFTVVGIGDMGGDVFGNGMLLSRKIKLVAAFNHRHIFLDPDPDPETSWQERKRLFELPRSTWEDYDAELISAGGGVFSRDAKEIGLSSEVRGLLGVRQKSMDGQQLIRAILAAEVDLVWNGGIGTYVKASAEKHEEVGDRANDGVRVDASNLRCRVVGEGGNLGMTQRARIEYALAGGRINTDAIDNSGGVDCSDHEVNLKIFLQHLREEGELEDSGERDQLLEEVTGEVCRDVLAHSYLQSQCLSLDLQRCRDDAERFFALTERLTQAGLLDRRGEFLPAAREVAARENRSLVRPELAILLAYSKMHLYQALLESALPDQERAGRFLESYFPGPIRERFSRQLPAHPLSREITATVITNQVVDQAGSTMVHHLAARTGAAPVDVVAAYLSFDEVLEGQRMRQELYALDNRVATERQYQLLRLLEDALATQCRWALENDLGLWPEAEKIAAYREKFDVFTRNLSGILGDADWGVCEEFAESLSGEGIPGELARRYAVLPYVEYFLPVVLLAESSDNQLYNAGRTFIEVRSRLGLDELLGMVDEVQLRDRWDRMAKEAVRSDFMTHAFRLTQRVLQEAGGNPDSFFGRRRQSFQLYQRLRQGVKENTPVNYHPFTVLASALEGLVEN